MAGKRQDENTCHAGKERHQLSVVSQFWNIAWENQPHERKVNRNAAQSKNL